MKRYTQLLLTLLLLIALVPVAPPASGEESAEIIRPSHYMPQGLLAGEALNITIAANTLTQPLTIVLDTPGSTVELNATVTQLEEGLYLLSTLVPEDTPPGVYDVLVYSNGTLIAREVNSLVVFDSWPTPLRIVQFTDIHVGLVHGDRPATSFLTAGLVFAEVAGAHVTIATGDNVDVGGMTAQYRDLLATLESFPLPIFLVPGNHERSGDPTLSNWEVFMGLQSFYYQRWGPFLFVGLDSSVNGYVPGNQLDWLEQVLRENADAPAKILFTHYPLFRTKLTGEFSIDPDNIQASLNLFYSTWANNPEAAARFVSIVDKYNVTLVLAGHVHADGLVVLNGKTLFVTTTSTGGGVREGDYRGAKLIEVYPNGTARIVPTPGAEPFDDDTAVNLQRLDARLIWGENTLSLVVEASDFKDAQHAACCIMTIGFRVPLDILGGSNATVLAISPGYKLPTNLTWSQSYALATAEVPIDPNMNFTIIATSLNDTQPPTLEVYSLRPKTPRMGKDQVEVTFKATDDAWGIKRITALYKTGESSAQGLPVVDVGRGFYKVIIPPVQAETVSLNIIAVDVSGKQAETGWINITYRPPPSPTQTTTTTTPQQTDTTTSPATTTTEATTTTTPPKETITPTTPPTAPATPTQTTTTTTQTQPATTTPSPTPTETVESPSPSPETTMTTQETPATQTPQTKSPAPKTPQPSATETPRGGLDPGVLVIVIGLVIAAAALAIAFRRR